MVGELPGGRTLVLGLGRSGTAVARYLLARGSAVRLSDQRTREQLEAGDFPFHEFEQYGDLVDWRLGGHDVADLEGCFSVAVSPGLSLHHPLLREAAQRGLGLLGEMELAWRASRQPMMAVTGTNGKSTTCTLLGSMLGERGCLGGNIGVPLLTLLDEQPASVEWVVAEVSSFQLETVHFFRPRVAVLTNLTPDHLDHHLDLDEYARAKSRLFAQMGAGDTAIFCEDDEGARQICAALDEGRLPAWAPGFPSPRADERPEILTYSVLSTVANGLSLTQDVDESGRRRVLQHRDGVATVLCEWDAPGLVGRAMESNGLAALTAGLAAGLELEPMQRALREFRPLHFRLEEVARVGQIRFVNDSKATNVAAALAAVDSVERPTCVIVGGKDKRVDYRALAEGLDQPDVEVLLIGEAAEPIASCLERQGHRAFRTCGDLATAVDCAYRILDGAGVVLLAPACSSFDQFQSAEHRGEVFVSLVERLKQQIRDEVLRGASA